jgi:hypothetical protein
VPTEDVIVFDVAGIEAERIKEDVEYEGVRVSVPASLDGARVRMQVDVGFGHVVDPSPAELPFPTLLPLDAPVIRAYPPEAVIAEKFQAMVALGIANRRMKDFLTYGRSQSRSALISRASLSQFAEPFSRGVRTSRRLRQSP